MCGHQSVTTFLLKDDFHLNSLLRLGCIVGLQEPIGDYKESHVHMLIHPHLTKKQSDHSLVQLPITLAKVHTCGIHSVTIFRLMQS